MANLISNKAKLGLCVMTVC
ncbi:hypothetical protein F383_33450 [Gossypium arboreum]|uniref:Uncharacterized protein n=1 Tax=Gossypium arboreum TaxID=29729 RepID=A0A0B0MXZ0_GOSAR|nr:hypothetical protein F383_33450 [Gossypium arboreum]